jgi:hypothetical protein
MIADYFTKPLQDSLFKKFWDFIMNGDPTSTTAVGLVNCRSVLEQEPMNPKRSEGQTWTLVGHEQDRKRRVQNLCRLIRDVQGRSKPIFPTGTNGHLQITTAKQPSD